MNNIVILSTTRSGHNFIAENIKSWLPHSSIVLLENVLPEHVYQHNLNGKRIIVIRDFENFVASALMGYVSYHGLEKNLHMIHMARVIKAYDEILKEALHPKYYKADLVIYYDNFVRDSQYRQKVCDKLGGKYNENQLNYVSSEGNGSSFDKLSYQHRGSEMKVTKRCEQILDTNLADIYKGLISENREVAKLWDIWKKKIK